MKRKDFLKGIGLAGVSTMLPAVKTAAGNNNGALGGPDNLCALIPTETAGPFPLDLTANPTFFRQDIRENKTGVKLNVKLKIVGLNNCLPMANLRVNIWHCDKDGLYSGYSGNNNPGQLGLTYLRGYQMTDVHGEVNFITIFPGWYTGRICHIHFQVYVSSVYAAISQLTFPIDAKNALYNNNSGLYTKGADPLTFNQDNIFSDGYNFQLATLTPNAVEGYDTYLEVAINGSGVSGLAELEPETGGQFKLGQNFPNPYLEETNIPFKLTNDAKVQIDVFDLAGNNVGTIPAQQLAAGEHSLPLNTKKMGLPNSNYIYQLQVENEFGLFRQCKMMTVMK
jgi:protocatechuate 3,4-dioxygenase beta subunit